MYRLDIDINIVANIDIDVQVQKGLGMLKLEEAVDIQPNLDIVIGAKQG